MPAEFVAGFERALKVDGAPRLPVAERGFRQGLVGYIEGIAAAAAVIGDRGDG